jgi:hypothetical protein
MGQSSSPPPPPSVPSLQEKKGSPVVAILLFLSLLVLCGGTAGYFFLVSPRIKTVAIIDEVKPQITSLKKSTKAVEEMMDTLYRLSTETSTPTSGQPLESSKGPTPPPIVAQGSIETSLLAIAQSLQGVTQSMADEMRSVAGTSDSAPNLNTQKLKNLQENAIKSTALTTQAKSDLSSMLTKVSSASSNMNGAKSLTMGSTRLKDKAELYFSEAGKLSGYFKKVADLIVSVNTKVTSFTLLLQSAGSTFASINNPQATALTMKSALDQSQIYLTKAKQETDDIVKSTNEFERLNKNEIPGGMEEHHQFVLSLMKAVTDYFTTQSNVLQGFITATSSTYTKATNQQLTSGDVRMLSSVIVAGVSESDTSDATFLASLQSLLGKETAITQSGWQNNNTIQTGKSVEVEIDSYDQALTKLRADSKIPLLIK